MPRATAQEEFKLTPSCLSCSLLSGIFGQRLEDTVQYERKYGQRLAPLLVEQCVDFIRERGLTEEGLFRMPGQANLVKDLQDSFDCGEKPLFDRWVDITKFRLVFVWHVKSARNPCSGNPSLHVPSTPSFYLLKALRELSPAWWWVWRPLFSSAVEQSSLGCAGLLQCFSLSTCWMKSIARLGAAEGAVGGIPPQKRAWQRWTRWCTAFRYCILPADVPGAISWLFLCHQVSG